jgi:hypothetical protein
MKQILHGFFFPALVSLLLAAVPYISLAQTGQVSINRITQMPDLPSPLSIRDWDAVTAGYDAFVFDLDKTGQYLPLIRLGTQGQFNYPDNVPIFMDTYVGGDNHLNVAEAINILPAIIGASLIGIDKSNQNGYNWVAMAKDFFNAKNNQDVYLNNYSATSGSDWWYDVMPNVYFYQMRSMYPDAAPEFDEQFTTVADRWLYSVEQLGGSSAPWSVPDMNYRAFNLATGQPLATGVAEPETAGSIAWLLYNAWLETGNRKYIEGAQQSLDFLQGWNTNPSYELQLPYGTLAAARMNAVEGTGYDINKMLNWCFDRGPLRGWGSITGTWGGYDVSGLIGEANDNGNDYAFIMNGFQQAAALAPIPKYDKRYARTIAKWLLNVTNASRLFYRTALPQANQDSWEWSLANDPEAVIPHESLKEVWLGKSPFARGDAINGGWAETNLSLYSGSSVGYLAAVVDTTNVPGILQIDLNKTDFYGQAALPSFLYYNPTTNVQLVNVALPTGTWGVYEALTETILSNTSSGQFQLSIPAGEARLIRFYNSTLTPQLSGTRLMAGDDILDYHYGYDYTLSIRIKGLAVDRNPVIISSEFTAYCEAGNDAGGNAQYKWLINDEEVPGETQPVATLNAPAEAGEFILKCIITLNNETVQDTLRLRAVESIPVPPVVNGIQSEFPYTPASGTNTFTALVVPAQGEVITYAWSIDGGTLQTTSGNPVTWQAPEIPGVYTITVQATNQDNAVTSVSAPVLVKDTTLQSVEPIIWYPLDYDELNAALDDFHATRNGAIKTPDARNIPSLAFRFTSGSDIIYTPNNAALNFPDAVTLSCWMKCEQLGSERYLVSHGSYQQRYKLSVTPEGYIRWTVKTSNGVADLDGSTPIELNRFYHITALYTGYSLELYIDGAPDTFRAYTGSLQPAEKNLTIGRIDNTETLYSWRGTIDEVKVWDAEIPVSQIASLKNEWATALGEPEYMALTAVWPNPSTGTFHIETAGTDRITGIKLYLPDGRAIPHTITANSGNRVTINVNTNNRGICLIKIYNGDGNVITRKILLHP